MIQSEYTKLFLKNSTHKTLTITFEDGTRLSNHELHQENFSLEEAICSENQLTFGACEASCLKFRGSNIVGTKKGQWLIAETKIDGTKSNFKFGKYKVNSDKPTADRNWRDFIAYDAMYDIINEDMTDWMKKVRFPLTCNEFAIEFLAHFNLNCTGATLINGDVLMYYTLDDDEKVTGKDIINALCEFNGCFGKINRNGDFEFKYLNENKTALYPANDLYPKEDLFPKIAKGVFPDDYLYPNESLFPSDPTAINLSAYYKSCQYEDYICQKITMLHLTDDEGLDLDIGDYGTNVYTISNNIFVRGYTEEELIKIFTPVLEQMAKVEYRVVSIELKGNPCVETGDLIRLNTKKEILYAFVMERKLEGIQALKDSFTAKGEEYYSQGLNSVQASINHAVRRVINRTQKELTAYDKAVQELSTLMMQAMGLFKSVEKLEDGSRIYYLHNSPSLANSKVQWKITAGAFAVSSDYGKTWNAGLTADGKATVNALSAIGISFDWASGGTLTLGGNGNVNGRCEVHNAKGEVIITLDEKGITLATGTTISWSNITGTPTIYDKDGIVKITKDTINAAYINALNITAKNVAADALNGKTIIGATIQNAKDNPTFKVDSSGHMVAKYGTFGGFSTTGGNISSSGSSLVANVVSGSSYAYGGGSYLYGSKVQGNDATMQLVSSSGNGLRVSESDVIPVGYTTLGSSDSGWSQVYADYLWAGYKGLQIGAGGNCVIEGSLNVEGEKNRVIKTEHYGKRKLYAYETPTPYFADIGEGVTDENGICIVAIDDIFRETIDSKIKYQVFIQPYGKGNIYVESREEHYFVVKGDSDVSFAWEVKAVQIDGTIKRLDTYEGIQIGIESMDILLDYSDRLNDHVDELVEDKMIKDLMDNSTYSETIIDDMFNDLMEAE